MPKHWPTSATQRFPPWAEVAKPDYPLPTQVPPGVRFGELDVDLYALPDGDAVRPAARPRRPDSTAAVPAFLPFPDRCSVLLEGPRRGPPRGASTRCRR